MAAFVKSVERITTTFPASSSLLTNVVNLTKGQDEAQCVPFYTMRFTAAGASDAKINNAVSVEFFDNAGTPAARIRRVGALAAASVQVEICVVEFASAVTVQRGVASLTATTATATISSVTQDNAFIVHTQHAQNSSNDDDFYEFFLQSKFNSNTEIAFERNGSGSQNWDVYWYVVESNGTDFKTEYVEITWLGSTDVPQNVTLSNAVTLDNAFLVSTYRSNEASDSILNAIANLALTGTTTLTLYRSSSSTVAGVAGVWVVRATSSELTAQRFATDVNGQLITDQPITSVDLDKAAVIPSSNVGGHGWAIDTSTFGFDSERRQHTTILTSATNAQSQRRESTTIGATGILRYEVVEFEIAAVGPEPQIVPVSLVEETDTVLDVTPVPGGVTLPVDLIEETDSVFAVTPVTGGEPQTVPVDLITETDSVQSVTPLPGEVTLLVGTVTETDEVFPVTPVPGAVSVSVEIVEELDQIAPVFPVVEGGPQTVLVVNVAERDFVFPVTPRIGPEDEDIKGGIPPIRKRKRSRKTRRYILPDNRVFTDPERALYELRELLKAEKAAAQTELGGGAAISETTPASLGQEISPPDTATEEPVTPQMLASAVSELPELLLARPEGVPSLDPQLISVLFQMIDDEEAAMLLL